MFYSTLRDRMNKVFWAWLYGGRQHDAARLVRAWEAWWARRHGVQTWFQGRSTGRS